MQIFLCVPVGLQLVLRIHGDVTLRSGPPRPQVSSCRAGRPSQPTSQILDDLAPMIAPMVMVLLWWYRSCRNVRSCAQKTIFVRAGMATPPPRSHLALELPSAPKAHLCRCLSVVSFSHAAAARVLGTLRAHCDRLECELRELDADVEEAKAMVQRHGEDMRESLQFLERLRATKAAKLHEAEQSLFHLASSYDKGMDEQPTSTPLPHFNQCPLSSVLQLCVCVCVVCVCQTANKKSADVKKNSTIIAATHPPNTLAIGQSPQHFTHCNLYFCLHQERRSSTKCSPGPSNM